MAFYMGKFLVKMSHLPLEDLFMAFGAACLQAPYLLTGESLPPGRFFL